MANERISDLPAAGPILGPELVPIVQNNETRKTTAGGLFNILPLGIQSYSFNSNFNDIVTNAPLVKDWVFGSSAVAPLGGTAVTNLTDLANDFTAFDFNTQQVTIQEQIEVYQPFNTTNFPFLTDRLNLVAVNPNSDWNVQVTQVSSSVNLNGTSTPVANFGLATTTGIRVGQLVSVQSHGIYYVSALVVDTSITLTTLNGSPTTASIGGLVSFLPVDSAVLTVQANNGDSTLTFGAVPAGVTTKQVAFVGIPTASIFVNRDKDFRVASATSTVVTLNLPIDYTAVLVGTRVLFLPAVTSAQIFSLPTWDISNPTVFFATEMTIDLLAGSAAYSLLGVNSLALFNAVPADTPWGAWPAFWSFGAPRGATLTTDASELDVFEMFNSTTAPSLWIAGNNHGSGVIATRFSKKDSGWSFAAGFNHAPFTLTGLHKWQFIFANGKTYRFLDGLLIKVDDYEWTSQAPLQIIANMSVGSIQFPYASNVMFPMASTNFPGYVFGIKELKVWYQTP